MVRCISASKFVTVANVMNNYGYSERWYFSLIDGARVILIFLKLWKYEFKTDFFTFIFRTWISQLLFDFLS